ncbi:type I 3-dehydroquinate dehydratase [Akkermansiaceae bacterium]|nr:type I 3-dehydroquinate dehydratase [Akkermansiaceae bacterium]
MTKVNALPQAAVMTPPATLDAAPIPTQALVVGAIADNSALKLHNFECDMIELRLDTLGVGADVLDFATNSPLPLLITARGSSEGGTSDWSIEGRQAAYEQFLPFATAIDIELRDFDSFEKQITSAKAANVLVVGSFHDFEQTPSLEILQSKLGSRADIHKFATRIQKNDDLVIHLSLLEGSSPLSVMGMGPAGAAARPLMAKAGSLLNYGYLGATPTAPDQWPAGLLKKTLSL